MLHYRTYGGFGWLGKICGITLPPSQLKTWTLSLTLPILENVNVQIHHVTANVSQLSHYKSEFNANGFGIKAEWTYQFLEENVNHCALLSTVLLACCFGW